MGEERIGSEVAGFRIVSVLGQGGMGTVYLAEQTSPRRKVVIKLLRPDLSKDATFRQRFVHESEAAASTEHPNIVPIYAAGEADGVLYIAMRYVEGDDLRKLISRHGALPPDRAIEIVSQVAAALDAAHARGLVHRDVKPGNILLDKGGNAYLSDFGLIKRSEVETGLTKTGQFMGSIEYCAPEQIRGEEVDGRADVYSLACVLYESIAGRPPFKRDTEVATLYAHLEQPPPSLPPGSPVSVQELDGVIAKAMAKRPADRHPTAGAFARAARHAGGVTSGERETVPRRARRWGVVLGILVAIGVIAGTIALLVRDDSTGPEPRGVATGSKQGVDSVVRLDPETGHAAQTIGGFSLQIAPFFTNGLAVGEGGVWVGSGMRVTHIDPLTGTIRASIAILGQQTGITLPAVAFRTVWVSTGRILERINPATDQLLPSIPLVPPTVATGSPGRTWIATGEERVWVASPNLLVQVDPVRGRVVRRIDVPGVTGLAVGEGSVWVIDDLSGQLLRFDPATGGQRGSASLPGNLDDVTAGGGGVWILDKGAGTVLLVDPTTLEVTDTIRVGRDERDVEYGGDAVWLADGEDASLTRIDPLTLQVAVFPVGGPARLVAVGSAPEDVWALVESPG